MKRMPKLLRLVSIAALVLLASCGPTVYSYQNVTVQIVPAATSLAAGSMTTFSANVTNAPNSAYWQLNGSVLNQAALGSLNNANGSSVIYTAPSTPPIYPYPLTPGFVQGSVRLDATIFSGITLGAVAGSGSQMFAITTPSVIVGIGTTPATVARGTTLQINGYAVGTLNNGVTYQVGGVTGGSTALGTISATGLYTAPTSIPIAGPQVVVTVVSVADSTKTATVTLTIT